MESILCITTINTILIVALVVKVDIKHFVILPTLITFPFWFSNFLFNKQIY